MRLSSPVHLLFVVASLVACRPASPADGRTILVDDAGDSVHLGASSERVVSLSPATTELLFAIGAGDRLVGRTRWCDYPLEALAVVDVGDAIPPNIEAVLARHPDLVLLYRSPQNAAAAARFRSAGIAAIQLTNDRLSDVPRLARLLGPLVGRAASAESLATAFERDLAAATVSDTLAPGRHSLLILAWDQPPIAIGGGSFQSELVTRAGGRNVFADLPVPSGTVSIEAITSRNPDFLLMNDSVLPGIDRRPEWQVVPAVRAHRYLFLRNSAFGRPGPRAPQLVRELRALIAGAPR
ncbi:MAG: helical backbone metal receptor [Gemmatimonadales bacterium]